MLQTFNTMPNTAGTAADAQQYPDRCATSPCFTTQASVHVLSVLVLSGHAASQWHCGSNLNANVTHIVAHTEAL